MANIKQVNKFIDLLNGEIDVEASALLSDLRDKRVAEVITVPNIIT